MQLIFSLASKFARSTLLDRLCAFAVILAMAGCGGSGNLKDDAEAQTELDRFRAKDMDYGKIVDVREETQKIIAMHGFGAMVQKGDPLDRYLNAILQKIIAVSPLPDLPARVVAVDLQHSPVAVAMKDGTIYVPFKLLADMNTNPNYASEDALAFLLAHELSHILYYHFHSDAVGDSVEVVKVATEVGYSLLKALEEGTGKTGKITPVVEKLDTFYKRVEVVQLLEESALTPTFTRKQEDEADLLAFDLMIKAGYNPDASYDFMSLLQAYEEEAENIVKRQNIDENDKEDGEKDPISQIAETIMTELQKGLGSLKRHHATASKRRKALNEYHDRWADKVADAEDIILRRLGWEKNSRAGDLSETDTEIIRKLFVNYEAAKNAETAIATDNYDKARTLIQQSLSTPTKFNAYPRIVAALYHEERGERTEAIEHIRQALQGPGPSFLVYEKYIRLLDDKETRLTVLYEAETKFGRFVRLMRLRATTLEKLGREEEARQVRELCYYENTLSKQRSECFESLELS